MNIKIASNKANATTRDVIVHAHIFKNAGTTIDWILRHSYGPSFHEDREDRKMVTEPDYLEALLENNKSLSAISSHSIPLPLKPIKGINTHVLVMLRHPILRVRSVYDFEKKQKAQTLGAIKAKTASFKEYVAWRMRADVPTTIRNMQVRYLTKNSLPKKEDLSDQYLESACAFIEKTTLVGFVEKFDQSLLIFKDYLSSLSLNLELDYEKQNVTSDSSLSTQEKLEMLESELGGDLFEVLIDKNRLDMALYERAIAVVDRRLEETRRK